MEDFVKVTLAIVLTGIMIAIGASVLQGFETATLDTATGSDNITLANATNVNLSNSWVQSITSVMNASGIYPTNVGGANWTLNNANEEVAGNFYLNEPTDALDGHWAIVNYTYLADSTASTAIEDAGDSLGELGGNWLPIIIIVLAASIIIGLVFWGIGKKNQ